MNWTAVSQGDYQGGFGTDQWSKSEEELREEAGDEYDPSNPSMAELALQNANFAGKIKSAQGGVSTFSLSEKGSSSNVDVNNGLFNSPYSITYRDTGSSSNIYSSNVFDVASNMTRMMGVKGVHKFNELYFELGCMGLTRDDYDEYRLNRAPFLCYEFKATDAMDMTNKVLMLLRDLPIPDPETGGVTMRPSAEVHAKMPAASTTSNVPITMNGVQDPWAPTGAPKVPIYDRLGITDPSKRVYGPAYIFAAMDQTRTPTGRRGGLECHLFLPSMTKDARPWPTYHYLGMCHRWMYRLIFSPPYRMWKPKGTCVFSDTYDKTFFVGCRTDADDPKDPTLANVPVGRTPMYDCVSSKKSHKKMRIYKKGRRREGYPAAYFRVYRINLENENVAPYINPNSFTYLQRNMLPTDMEMFVGCRYMLMSPNFKYFLILGSDRLSLYENVGKEDIVDLCLRGRSPRTILPIKITFFGGGYDTRLVFEENLLNIYSKEYEGAEEKLVFSAAAVSQMAKKPIVLMLTDSGTLVSYDSENKLVGTGDLLGTVAMGPYDPNEDYRQRLINLIAYLRLVGRYKEEQPIDPNSVVPLKAPEIVFENIPPFNSSINYVERLKQLVESMRGKGSLTASDPYYMTGYTPPYPDVIVPEGTTKPSLGMQLDTGAPVNGSGNQTFAGLLGIANTPMPEFTGYSPYTPEDEVAPPRSIDAPEYLDAYAGGKLVSSSDPVLFPDTPQGEEAAIKAIEEKEKRDLEEENVYEAGVEATEPGAVPAESEDTPTTVSASQVSSEKLTSGLEDAKVNYATQSAAAKAQADEFYGRTSAQMTDVKNRTSALLSTRPVSSMSQIFQRDFAKVDNTYSTPPVCPRPAGVYNQDEDFYCRLISLRDYIRGQKPNTEGDSIAWGGKIGQDTFRIPENKMTSTTPYDPSASYNARLDALATSISKPST